MALPLAGTKEEEKMQAIILAAGSAKRLRPLTDDRPKCMLEVGDRAIFEYQLEALAARGVDRVVVVVGWCAEVFEPYRDRAELVLNPDFASTNSLYSYWLCRQWIDRETLLLNGDVLFSAELLGELLESAHPDALLIDPRARLDEEAMKVRVEDGRVRAMNKEMPAGQAGGASRRTPTTCWPTRDPDGTRPAVR